MVDYATLLASAVHDMKNSIGVLLSSLEELPKNCTQGCPLPHRRDHLMYDASRLNQTLLQLLAIYKIDNKRYQPSIAEHHVAEFLAEIVDAHTPLLQRRGIHVTTSCPDDLIHHFDEAMIAAVLGNVFHNAYKYARSRVSINARLAGAHLCIDVDDDGPGYPEELLTTNPQSPTPVDFEHGSTSLGLYFSMLIADLHRHRDNRGCLRCSNDGIDGGARFALRLP